MTIMDALIRNESSVFVKKFVLLEQIGQGSSSMVYRCKRISDGMICAVKIVSLKHLKFHYSQRDIEAASVKEIHILKELNHPSIVKIHEHFIEADHLFIIEEYAPGKELFEVILDKPKRCLTEDEAKPIIIQLIDAVEYLHSQEIVHRDIKPENIKLVYEGAEPRIKLLDFGVSRKLEHEKYAQTYVGTPSYLAPEMLRGRRGHGGGGGGGGGGGEEDGGGGEGGGGGGSQLRYGPGVDNYAVGAVAYVTLVGRFPELDVRTRFPVFRPDIWGRHSAEARNLLKGLLHPDPDQRLSLASARAHPWFTGMEWLAPRLAQAPGLPQVPRPSGPLPVPAYSKSMSETAGGGLPLRTTEGSIIQLSISEDLDCGEDDDDGEDEGDLDDKEGPAAAAGVAGAGSSGGAVADEKDKLGALGFAVDPRGNWTLHAEAVAKEAPAPAPAALKRPLSTSSLAEAAAAAALAEAGAPPLGAAKRHQPFPPGAAPPPPPPLPLPGGVPGGPGLAGAAAAAVAAAALGGTPVVLPPAVPGAPPVMVAPVLPGAAPLASPQAMLAPPPPPPAAPLPPAGQTTAAMLVNPMPHATLMPGIPPPPPPAAAGAGGVLVPAPQGVLAAMPPPAATAGAAALAHVPSSHEMSAIAARSGLGPMASLQSSISDLLRNVLPAYLDNPRLASTLRQGAILCRGQMRENDKLLKRIEHISSAILELFGDLELAVEENEPELARGFFESLRKWVSELGKSVRNAQKTHKSSTQEVHDLMEKSTLLGKDRVQAVEEKIEQVERKAVPVKAVMSVDRETFEVVKELKNFAHEQVAKKVEEKEERKKEKMKKKVAKELKKRGLTDDNDEAQQIQDKELKRKDTGDSSDGSKGKLTRNNTETSQASSTASEAPAASLGDLGEGELLDMLLPSLQKMTETLSKAHTGSKGDDARSKGFVEFAEGDVFALEKRQSTDESSDQANGNEGGGKKSGGEGGGGGGSVLVNQTARLEGLEEEGDAVRALVAKLLGDLYRIDQVMDILGALWSNIEVVLEILVVKAEHTEKFVQYASKPAILQRFKTRLNEYYRFWKSIQTVCQQFFLGAGAGPAGPRGPSQLIASAMSAAPSAAAAAAPLATPLSNAPLQLQAPERYSP